MLAFPAEAQDVLTTVGGAQFEIASLDRVV